MSAITTIAQDTTHNAGVPPVPPEAHQQAEGRKAKKAAKVAAAPSSVQLIPFSSLFLSADNVRKHRTDEGIAELAALILSQGLLQNLSVVPEVKKGKATGRYGVIAGGRRYQALSLLVERGDVAAETAYECRVHAPADALAVSTAENAGRLALHPADQFAAFAEMVAKGRSVEEVAAAFGVEVLTVQRRLKLAKVAPELMALFREGGIKLECLMAFTLTDDHERQMQVWNGLRDWERSNPHSIRRALTENEVSERSSLARFVGVEAYEAAGGKVRTDLFVEDGRFLVDVDVLHQLADAKLDEQAEGVRGEGWAWVETRLLLDHSELHTFGRIEAVRREPTAEEQAELDRVGAELERAEEGLRELYESDDEESDEQNEAIERLEAESTALQGKLEELEAMLCVEPEELKAIAGVIVAVNGNGEVQIVRGLIRPEDRKEAKKVAATAAVGGSAEGAAPKLSDALALRLTAERTAALQAALAQRPDVALVAVVHRLALSAFFTCYTWDHSVIKIRADNLGMPLDKACPEIEASRGYRELAAVRDSWLARLPKDAGQLWGWLLVLPQDELLSLLAVCVAQQVDTVESRPGKTAKGAELAQALHFDMADWWKPAAATYFGHIPKLRIMETLSGHINDAKRGELDKLKKGELVEAAEAVMLETRWLPEILRY